MQFGSYVDTCPTCRGHKVIEVLEERTDANTWVRNDMVPVALWDAALGALPDSLRIETVTCFDCAGAGRVEYEAVGCKIF